MILSLSSIMSGAVFGLLDVFGFIDGRHTLSLSLLLGAAGLTYISLVTVFLLNFAKKSRIVPFLLVSSALFAITFFFMNLNFILTFLSSLVYMIFLVYVYSASVRRSELFVKFVPQEVFFPILRKSFTFILVVLAIMTYSQSQKLISNNSLVSPGLVNYASKPSIYFVNQQINSQLFSGEAAQIIASVPDAQREQVIRTALEKTLEQMADSSKHTVYGIPLSDIPIEMAGVDQSGRVDIGPVIQEMLPTIAQRLNALLQQYAPIVPFIIALLVILIMQPFIIPIQLLESLITLIVFKILTATQFIHIRKIQKEVDVPYLSE